MRIAEIRILGEFWVSLTMRWPKSTLAKFALKTLGQNKKFLCYVVPHVREEEPPRCDQTNQMMREKCVMSDGWNDLQHWPIYIHQWGCVTHLLGLQAYITNLADLAHKWNKFKINVQLIGSRWSLDRSCTSPKEESNKNIGIFIWASQHGVWT